ncbi:MAG: hypothetical protein U5M53_01570 [Rhodoferax sp.]|nr:hypothetical protein [Rhodoferax sp.]
MQINIPITIFTISLTITFIVWAIAYQQEMQQGNEVFCNKSGIIAIGGILCSLLLLVLAQALKHAHGPSRKYSS